MLLGRGVGAAEGGDWVCRWHRRGGDCKGKTVALEGSGLAALVLTRGGDREVAEGRWAAEGELGVTWRAFCVEGGKEDLGGGSRLKTVERLGSTKYRFYGKYYKEVVSETLIVGGTDWRATGYHGVGGFMYSRVSGVEGGFAESNFRGEVERKKRRRFGGWEQG